MLKCLKYVIVFNASGKKSNKWDFRFKNCEFFTHFIYLTLTRNLFRPEWRIVTQNSISFDFHFIIHYNNKDYSINSRAHVGFVIFILLERYRHNIILIDKSSPFHIIFNQPKISGNKLFHFHCWNVKFAAWLIYDTIKI